MPFEANELGELGEPDEMDRDDFGDFCRGATDGQLEAILAKEYEAGRRDDYQSAKAEAKRRGWVVRRGRVVAYFSGAKSGRWSCWPH